MPPVSNYNALDADQNADGPDEASQKSDERFISKREM